jgi:hypothetical protein
MIRHPWGFAIGEVLMLIGVGTFFYLAPDWHEHEIWDPYMVAMFWSSLPLIVGVVATALAVESSNREVL